MLLTRGHHRFGLLGVSSTRLPFYGRARATLINRRRRSSRAQQRYCFEKNKNRMRTKKEIYVCEKTISVFAENSSWREIVAIENHRARVPVHKPGLRRAEDRLFTRGFIRTKTRLCRLKIILMRNISKTYNLTRCKRIVSRPSCI